MSEDHRIYKVVDAATWERACEVGVFEGAEIDITDGFIHFSSASQVRATVDKHFRGQANLVLIGFESDQFGEALKWEVSRDGQRFPHLYGKLPTSLAVSKDPLGLNEDGTHTFPVSFGS